MALFLLAHLGLLNGTCLAVEQGIPHASRHLIGRRHGLPLFHIAIVWLLEQAAAGRENKLAMSVTYSCDLELPCTNF